MLKEFWVNGSTDKRMYYSMIANRQNTDNQNKCEINPIMVLAIPIIKKKPSAQEVKDLRDAIEIQYHDIVNQLNQDLSVAVGEDIFEYLRKRGYPRDN